jgi:hypothetical protein
VLYLQVVIEECRAADGIRHGTNNINANTMDLERILLRKEGLRFGLGFLLDLGFADQ